jgi:hypothetical protein
MLASGERHVLKGLFVEKNLFAAENAEFLIERIAREAHFSNISILLDKEDNSPSEATELLTFHHSFFLNFFDIAYSRDVYLLGGQFPREAPVAAMTFYAGDSASLRHWAKHYCGFIPPRNIYILDPGTFDDPTTFLAPEINVISAPIALGDTQGRANIYNKFQRFLLSSFRWVLHMAQNEILLHKNGMNRFIHDLQEQHEHDMLGANRWYNIDRTAALPDQQLTLIPDVVKPVLASVPTTWRADFASIFERQHTAIDPDLWVVRLTARRLDLPTPVPSREASERAGLSSDPI